MSSYEKSFSVRVLDNAGRPAHFNRLRLDAEFSNEAGQTVFVNLAEIEEPANRSNPIQISYTLRKENVLLWIVLAWDHREERQKISPDRWDYVFGDDADAKCRGDAHGGRLTVVIQTALFVGGNATMTSYNEKTSFGDVHGIVNYKSTLENVTQAINSMSTAEETTKGELRKLTDQLFDELAKVSEQNRSLADDVSAHTVDLVEKATNANPNKTLLQHAISGLKTAAETLKDAVPSIFQLATSIGTLIAKLHGISI